MAVTGFADNAIAAVATSTRAAPRENGSYNTLRNTS
jgi:hypothetical protein